MTEENRQELSKLCEVIRQTVAAREIYLFGSYAYGTPHEDSDYDLYVVIPDDGPRPIAAMKDLNVALHKHCRKALDILVAKESRFSGRVNAPTLERTVKEKGVLLYSGPAGHDMENPTGVSVQKKEQSEQDGDMELNKYPETGLPGYLQHDLDAYEEGCKRAPLCWTACGANCTPASMRPRSTMGLSPRSTPSICERNSCIWMWKKQKKWMAA